MFHEEIPGTPTLSARHLVRTFGDGHTKKAVIKDVSLELYPGQLSMLMGPSGSGKSTLLALMSGLLRPDTGHVLVLEQDLWTMTERQREAFRLQHCGFVFQGYNLFPALTARQQLEMVMRWGKGATRREVCRRADEWLEKLGLAPQAGQRPAELSGGEKQRVAIGRALIKDPTFCFADEPTSALDWENGEQVIEHLRSAAHEHNATILLVAHDQRIIPHVDRVLHLEDGVLAESSQALDLVESDLPAKIPLHLGPNSGRPGRIATGGN